MFSYRHAFHAGNHADVLKHVVLLQLLQYACQKETPCFYIDTHAGEGIYALHGEQAKKNAEFKTGITRLWDRKDLPPAIADYRKLIQEMNPDGRLRHYPGSPYIAEKVLRDQDRLRLFELHGSDSRLLEKNFRKLEAHYAENNQKSSARGRRIIVEKADGFAALKALLPPPSRRAVTLLDPPYEDKKDYRRTIDTLADATKRFATGTYAVWYPLLQRIEARRFQEQLKNLPGMEWLNVTLSISEPSPDGFGLTGSGMFVINPPWKLVETLKEIMPYLVTVLGQDDEATFTVETGKGKPVKKKTDDDD